MKRVYLLFLILICINFAIAHEEELSDNEVYPASSTNDIRIASPYHQAIEGNYGQALFYLAIWAGIIFGLYQLVMLLLSRIIKFKD